MAEIIKVTGIVTREIEYGENDKLLTVLTAERGLITVGAKGAKSPHNTNRTAARLLFYGELTLNVKNDRIWLREASTTYDFYNITMGIERLSLVSYLFEIMNYVCFSDDDDALLLRLLLNTLYVLVDDKKLGNKPLNLIKSVFELRCAACLGYAPDVRYCRACGASRGQMYIDMLNGDCLCEKCAKRTDNSGSGFILSDPMRRAAEYIINAPIRRLFAFSISEDILPAMYEFTEQYLTNKVEHHFDTLDYYHKVVSNVS